MGAYLLGTTNLLNLRVGLITKAYIKVTKLATSVNQTEQLSKKFLSQTKNNATEKSS
jgi:hypothetical protein